MENENIVILITLITTTLNFLLSLYSLYDKKTTDCGLSCSKCCECSYHNEIDYKSRDTTEPI